MNSKTLIATQIASILIGSFITLQHAQSAEIIDEQYRKAVNNVVWHTQTSISVEKVINKPIPTNMTSLIFIRRQDNDPVQTSANIAVNDKFQVSLQPNGYSQVYTCSGRNFLSAEVTGLKTNDLLLKSTSFDLQAQNTYYFYVDIDDENSTSSIIQITEPSAQSMLKNKKYQTHQISRVVQNCPVIEPVIAPVIAPPIATPKIQIPKLTTEVNIELEVLFDTNKDIIKPPFYQEVSEVAKFMTAYKNTTATIEGHTDSRGSTNYNQELSERRANAVKNMLTARYGIAADRIKAIGYGEMRPRAANDTSSKLQKNRRVIAVINERVRLDENGQQIND